MELGGRWCDSRYLRMRNCDTHIQSQQKAPVNPEIDKRLVYKTEEEKK